MPTNLLRMPTLSLHCQRCFHPTSVDRLSAGQATEDLIITMLLIFFQVLMMQL